MRELVIGIDSGTQSTKTLVLDVESRKVVASASEGYDLLPGLGPGAKEQDPACWLVATEATIRAALKEADAKPEEVRAIGVSGQQHGFVPLDAQGQVIRPAKLWCDTSTIKECDQITARLGGLDAAIAATGNAIAPGFTAPKILWLKNHEPENYARLATVLLPHDYLNFWLSGRAVMEYGDASGTTLFDVRRRVWSDAAVEAIDSGLKTRLPEVIGSDQLVGRIRPELAQSLGISPEAVVSAGGGDNMMGAIGTGATRPGVVTASFGTSGTIYALSDGPIVDPKGEIAAFCDSTNRWLPLLCTMNVTVATETVRDMFGWELSDLEAAVALAPVGSEGLLLLPYLEGERTPNVPDGCGTFLGMTASNFRPQTLARATMEGVTLGMNYGLRRLGELGVTPTQIRATGGGAKSSVWRQIMADVFNAEVVTLEVAEGAAYGAALQALWSYRNGVQGATESIESITEAYVTLNSSESVRPNPEAVSVYEKLQTIQDAMSSALRPVFSQRRELL